jgi:hypothetical protein
VATLVSEVVLKMSKRLRYFICLLESWCKEYVFLHILLHLFKKVIKVWEDKYIWNSYMSNLFVLTKLHSNIPRIMGQFTMWQGMFAVQNSSKN